MSIYRIDPGDSKEDGIVLVKISGRAHAETIVKLLGRIARARRNAASLHPYRGVRFQPRHWRPQPHVPAAEGAERVSVFNDRARAKAWLLES